MKNRRPFGDAEHEVVKGAGGCKRKNRFFKQFQTDLPCRLEPI
jgi:hypothetical protein